MKIIRSMFDKCIEAVSIGNFSGFCPLCVKQSQRIQ